MAETPSVAFLAWAILGQPLTPSWLRSSDPFTLKGGAGRVWPARSVHGCSPLNLCLSTAPFNTADENIKSHFLWDGVLDSPWCVRQNLNFPQASKSIERAEGPLTWRGTIWCSAIVAVCRCIPSPLFWCSPKGLKVGNKWGLLLWVWTWQQYTKWGGEGPG